MQAEERVLAAAGLKVGMLAAAAAAVVVVVVTKVAARQGRVVREEGVFGAQTSLDPKPH
jgi:hypothetical protein